MKGILWDIRRALTGRWFLLAVLASAMALYMSIGQESYMLLCELRDIREMGDAVRFRFDLADMLCRSMTGDFAMLTLPALVALPFAGQPLQEIQSGALRPAIFRVGRRNWVLGKGVACVLSGVLLPLTSAALLALGLNLLALVYGGMAFPTGDLSLLSKPLVMRMISGGIWASVGCLLALLTETAAAACLAPLCLCYALTMIGTRFFPQIELLHPANWLTGNPWPILLIFALSAIALCITLRREALRHA